MSISDFYMFTVFFAILGTMFSQCRVINMILALIIFYFTISASDIFCRNNKFQIYRDNIKLDYSNDKDYKHWLLDNPKKENK